MAQDAAFMGRMPPAWYDEAKFGVFIHWGLFSIPAFAPRVGKISDIFKTDYRRAVALSPYTEWYENAIKSPDTPSAEFHRQTYGGAPYETSERRSWRACASGTRTPGPRPSPVRARVMWSW